MPSIVPPRPRTRVVIGRPKTRAAGRACLWLLCFAILAGWLHPDWQDGLLVTSLFVGALGAAAVAGVLFLVERPREFVEHHRPPFGPIFYVSDSLSVRHPSPSSKRDSAAVRD
jgi:hypothetical protein